MSKREFFEKEMDALERDAGTEARNDTYALFGDIVRWLRATGHGDVKLSAVGHRFSGKYRIDSVIKVQAS